MYCISSFHFKSTFFVTDGGDGSSLGPGMGGMGVKGGSGAGVATSDAQYMQQQSQIFVFTTHLANKAAEAVMQGSFSNIIAFHCAQPGTKKLLEVLFNVMVLS